MEPENEQAKIEQEFSRSWDLTEEIYSTVFGTWKPLGSMLSLITKLRAHSYDKKLRAGKSLSRFILSRSRHFGLRRNQPNLGFDLYPNGGMTLIYFEPPDEEIHVDIANVGLTPEVEKLLARLLAHPID